MAIRQPAGRQRPKSSDDNGSQPRLPSTMQSPLASRMLSGFLVVVLVALIGVIYRAGNRGLDLTDEGFYLQLYSYPESAPASAVSSQFYLLVDLMTGPFDLGIVGYRVVALLLLLCSGTFFGFALHRFAVNRIPEIEFPPLVATMALIAISGLLGYAWAPLAVSYNTLSAALVHSIGGLVLLAMSGVKGIGLSRWWWVQVSLAGALIPFLFYTKWPAAALLAGVLSILVVLVDRQHSHKLLGVAAAGSAASFVVFTEELFMGPFSLQALSASARIVSSTGHSPAELVEAYVLMGIADTVRVLWEDPFRVVAITLLLAGGFLASLLKSSMAWLRSWMLPALGGTYLLAELPNSSYLDRLTNFKLVAALLVAGAISVFLAQLIRTRRLPDISIGELTRTGQLLWLLALLGLGLALVTGTGSNSHILTNALHGGAGVGATVVVALSSLRAMAGRDRQSHFLIAMPVLALLLAGQVFNGVWVDPYRLTSARAYHEELIPDIPRFEGIGFDSQSAKFLSEVNRLVQEETSFAPGHAVLAYAAAYGLVYMIDGVSPGVPWISPPETGEQDTACVPMRAVSDAIAETTLILENSPPSDELASCLQELIPGYPQLFVEVGRVAIPGGYGSGAGTGEFLRVLELRR